MVAFASDLLCILEDRIGNNKGQFTSILPKLLSGISHVQPVPANFPYIFSGKLKWKGKKSWICLYFLNKYNAKYRA